MLPIALFGKTDLYAELAGVTHDNIDMSVDTFKNCLVPMLQYFGIEGISIETK